MVATKVKWPRPVVLPSMNVDWKRAACRGFEDLFFDQTPATEALARRICYACPIRAECLNWALETPEHYGMWGGLSEKQRQHVNVPRHRVKCPGCGSFDVTTKLLKTRNEVCAACGLSWSI